MILRLLLSGLLVLPDLVIAQQFSPTSGQEWLANVTQTIAWNFTVPFSSCLGIGFGVANTIPPSYTTYIYVDSRKFYQERNRIALTFRSQLLNNDFNRIPSHHIYRNQSDKHYNTHNHDI